MRRETRNAVLSVPRDVAFDFLSDYRNDLLWRPELKAAELVSGTCGEAGARYAGTVEWHDMSAPHELDLVACSRPSRLHFNYQVSDLALEVVYNLYDKGPDACYLTVDYIFEIAGPLSMLEPFGWGLFMGWVDDDLPRLPVVLLEQQGR